MEYDHQTPPLTSYEAISEDYLIVIKLLMALLASPIAAQGAYPCNGTIGAPHPGSKSPYMKYTYLFMSPRNLEGAL